MSEFEGKGAVITGGANGIGLATATELARRGVRLVLADVDKPALEQAVAHLQGQGFEAHPVMCDVRSLEEMTHLADEAFLTGTAAEVVPIRAVDDRQVGDGKPGPITVEVQQTYFAAVRGEVDRYKDWLDHVD